MNEEKIKLMMNKLGLTREEAIELIEDDEKVDKMTSAKQWDSDLSDEQKKAIKKAKGTGRKVNETPTKREKKVDNTKKMLIETLKNSLDMATNFEVLNDEREFTFTVNGEKFKVVLSKPRK